MLFLHVMGSVHAAPCDDYEEPEVVIDFDASVEASGLVASALRPGVFFTHGDMDDPDAIVSFDADGLVEEHDIDDASNLDWEDLAAGPCPDGSTGCLYVGDIGASDGDMLTVDIYVVHEPAEGEADLPPLEIWSVPLPEPSDAEALLVHPVTGEVTLVTKGAGDAKVLRLLSDHSGFVEIDEVGLSYVTSGDWDATGERVVLRTGSRVHVWDADPDDPDDHWGDDPIELESLLEERGEAATFVGTELYTLGREQPLKLLHYPCVPAGDEEEPDPDPVSSATERSQPTWIAAEPVSLASRGCVAPTGPIGSTPIAAAALLLVPGAWSRRRSPPRG